MIKFYRFFKMYKDWGYNTTLSIRLAWYKLITRKEIK